MLNFLAVLWGESLLPGNFTLELSFFSKSSIFKFIMISMLLRIYSKIWKQFWFYIILNFSSLRLFSLMRSNSSHERILIAKYKSVIASFTFIIFSFEFLNWFKMRLEFLLNLKLLSESSSRLSSSFSTST